MASENSALVAVGTNSGVVTRPATPRSASKVVRSTEAPAGPRRFLYLLLSLAIIPLAFSVFAEDGSVVERFEQAYEEHPEAFQGADGEGADLDSILTALPDQRLAGAHLSKQTWVHWIYAFASAGAFLAVAIFLFKRGTANAQQLLAVGASTATLGIISLLLIQLAASLTNGILFRGNIVILIAFYVLKFIAFSYQCASDPENGFLLSFFGYTFGVGMCEELVKAAPMLLRMRSPQGIDWRGACVWSWPAASVLASPKESCIHRTITKASKRPISTSCGSYRAWHSTPCGPPRSASRSGISGTNWRRISIGRNWP